MEVRLETGPLILCSTRSSLSAPLGQVVRLLRQGKSAKCDYYLSRTQGWNSDDDVTILQAGGLLQALGSGPALRDILPQVEEVVDDPIEEQSNVSGASRTPHKSTAPPSASVTARTPSVEAGIGRISRRSSAVKPSVVEGSSSVIDKGKGFLWKRPRETPSFGSTPSKKRRRNPLDGEVLPWPVSMVDFEDLGRLHRDVTVSRRRDYLNTGDDGGDVQAFRVRCPVTNNNYYYYNIKPCNCVGSANNPAAGNPPPPSNTADTLPPRHAWHQGRAGGKEAMSPAPDKRGSTSSKPSTVGSGLQGPQACTLSRAYATEVAAALTAAIRRPLTVGTARKEIFCPRPSASNVLLDFLLFFALRRQAHGPDSREGALVAQTCVASCT
ncbi:hypothetical protein GB937_007612 [Aspergillus fischeri]|nr:hypothetical protein GB937_007612 [Aspergillus fischeri]